MLRRIESLDFDTNSAHDIPESHYQVLTASRIMYRKVLQ